MKEYRNMTLNPIEFNLIIITNLIRFIESRLSELPVLVSVESDFFDSTDS